MKLPSDSSSCCCASAALPCTPQADTVVMPLQHFHKNQCTANLHWLVCRVRRQEVARGALAKDGEWWGERLVRHLKSFCKKISK